MDEPFLNDSRAAKQGNELGTITGHGNHGFTERHVSLKLSKVASSLLEPGPVTSCH